MKKTLLALAIAALFTACSTTAVPPSESATPGYSSGTTPQGEIQPICQPTNWDVGCYGQKGGNN